MKLTKPILVILGLIGPIWLSAQPKTFYARGYWMPWWNHYTDSLDSSMLNAEVFYMYPDTHVVSFTSDTSGIAKKEWVSWCEIGKSIDPKSQTWPMEWRPDIFYRYRFMIDSLEINYSYQRFNPDSSVVDTLVVKILNDELCGGFYLGESDSLRSPIALPPRDCQLREWNTAFKLLLGPDAVTKNPSASDTFPDFKSLRLIQEYLSRAAMFESELLAVTMEFRPGQSYNFGDTLYMDSALLSQGYRYPTKTLNRFGILVSVQEPARKLDSYNNGLFVNKSHKYGDPPNTPDSLKGLYQSSFFERDSQRVAYFPHIGLFYANGGSNAKRPGSVSQFEVWPVPTGNRAYLRLEMKVPDNLSLLVYDISGRNVMEVDLGNLPVGSHQIPLDVTSLYAGVYEVVVRGDDSIQSNRLMVSK